MRPSSAYSVPPPLLLARLERDLLVQRCRSGGSSGQFLHAGPPRTSPRSSVRRWYRSDARDHSFCRPCSVISLSKRTIGVHRTSTGCPKGAPRRPPSDSQRSGVVEALPIAFRATVHQYAPHCSPSHWDGSTEQAVALGWAAPAALNVTNTPHHHHRPTLHVFYSLLKML